MNYAPIVLFAYSRLDHLKRTIDSLLRNEESAQTNIYIYCDGPRCESDIEKVNAVRNYVQSINGFLSVKYVFRNANLGLAASVISGVTEILNNHEKVIVMEDDLQVSSHFLKFMNDGLAIYKNDAQVASIHGYIFPVEKNLPETFFMRGADCWGWATWRRAWDVFEPDGKKLLEALMHENLSRKFDLDGSYPYLKMLRNQIAGKNNSWAIRWRASCYIKNMITLYPGVSLVNNIGMDNSGTHCSTTDAYFQNIATDPVIITRQPLEENEYARAAVADFFRKQMTLWKRGKRFIEQKISTIAKVLN